MNIPAPGLRYSEIERETLETTIRVSIDLDGSGTSQIDTGIGFFDHMLTQISRHGLFDLVVHARGDLYVDEHHLIEDVGICLGKVCSQALGERKGIHRYGWSVIPMDEALAMVAIDFSGRSHLEFDAPFSRDVVGMMPTELVREFFHAFVNQSASTVHVRLMNGSNSHHAIEAIFKAFAKSLEMATRINPRQHTVPSTKGVLDSSN